MAVLSYDSVMSSAENDQTTDSSHENNLYADRQLQNKLLQLDEDSDNDAYDQKLSRSWSYLKGNTKNKNSESITGWFPNSKFVGRKNELQRPETKPAFIHPWKDYRSRGKEESFVFKHYTEYRKYIEQYRIEHGCHVNRFPSGNQIGDMRRIAFQGSAPPQHSPISIQHVQQSNYTSVTPQPPVSSNHQSSLHYANRKEQLGTLITGTNGHISNKSNHIEHSSHAQKYRVNNTKLPRNNTVYDMRNPDSDNSSDCGDIRFRSSSRRSNSASSQRARSRNVTKSPTKITVPASPNPRSYPLQALTIALKARYRQRQQNGKPDVCPSPKPLDNLNCVAPEKQNYNSNNNNNSEKKSIEPNLELALRVHSLNDLLLANDAPIRGYALPKSLPPNPNNSHTSKSLKRDQELANLTWSEKLEALRSVNKPSEKTKPKQPKLKFVKAEQNEAMLVWSLAHDPQHEQRRIRSLVEQARLKSGKQYDWVYEAHVRHRDIDWKAVDDEEGKDHENGEMKIADNQSVVKYGIYSSTSETIKQTLFSSRSSDKSNTSQT